MRLLLAITCGALVALAGVTAALALTPTVTLKPTSGAPGQPLVATYSYKAPATGCGGRVTWSFAAALWTQSTVSGSRPSCSSSTSPTPPPVGFGPGVYEVCGSDPAVTTAPSCAKYTIKAGPSPSPTPAPSPKTSPSPPAPSPSPSTEPTPGASPSSATLGQPSPSGSPVPGAATGSGGPHVYVAGDGGGFPGWPWPDGLLLSVAVLVAVAAFLDRAGILHLVPAAGSRPAWLRRPEGPDSMEAFAAKASYRSSAFPPPADHDESPRGEADGGGS